ncbi:unnamed protein product [Cuscuta campestris]|uniref:SWI/SNF-like complex subunit BAF250 C-terminal domain-containing protein n=2 Tax=Cuscuta sect. Cleistogrammica TaxID=1824901 RepID=A0A484MHU6_9ASTE|nr:hypothetical protein DM860_001712 [Cuscuta australis]VFQ87556.1 unnamed protein product [Cuscuta campestris]
MQKRDNGKQGGGPGGGSAPPASRRGRPFGSVANNPSTSGEAAADAVAPPTLLGPSLQVHSAFAEQNNKRIVLSLQSGLKSELTWALNTLTLLSFKEKDDIRKDATPLAKIPGLLDALLQVIDDWRDISLPKVIVKAHNVILRSDDPVPHPSSGSGISNKEASAQNAMTKSRSSGRWFEKDGLFNLDEEGHSEKQLYAVAASNIIRNFSFMPDNVVIMAQHRRCLETLFQCMEDYATEDEELVTNALEAIVNLAHLLDLRIFSSSKPSFLTMTENRAVLAIKGLLDSAVQAWHCAAAELISRLIINSDNEPFLLPFAAQIYTRLVDLLSFPTTDAQAAAVGVLYNLTEINSDCRQKLATERWAIDRLLKVIKAPHPVPEICRKAALVLESLVSEPQNKTLLLGYEHAFTEMLFGEPKYSDIFARILYELTSRPSNKITTARGIWGM